MKLFMATLATETNTFSPIPTGLAAFHARGFQRRDGARAAPTDANLAMIEWSRLAGRDGYAVVDSLCAVAEPAGITVRAAYEALRNIILDDLQAALPVDVVLLKLHGAMVAQGCEDCEGNLLARVRALAGPAAVIGAELDLHCHLTGQMCASADIIITYKEYPHTDVADRARELYELCLRARRGEIRPVMAYDDCRMISMWRTPVEPMRGFVARMSALEGHDGILSVSFGHGFPWADVADVGAKILVVADGDAGRAAALARRLGEELWHMRNEAVTPHDTIAAAIDAALAAPAGRPVVLADVADNAGGGAPSDSTPLLRRLLERGVTGVASGCYWDPVAVSFCREAGAGARLELRIGGKCGPASGLPVDMAVEVMAVSDAHTQCGLAGGRSEFGPSAWVRARGIDLILTSVRGQVFHPDAFTGLGCTLTDKRIVVVKSTQHFHAGFAPIAAAVRYVDAPGAIGPDFAAIPYTRRTRPYWPRVADPFLD